MDLYTFSLALGGIGLGTMAVAGLGARGGGHQPSGHGAHHHGAGHGHGAHAGEVRFTRPIRAADDVARGEYGIPCTIRYQACNARQCLPPASATLLARVLVGDRR